MNKEAKKIREQLKILIKEYSMRTGMEKRHPLYKIDELLNNYLKKNPEDIQMWEYFAIAEYSVPIADYGSTAKCLKKILSLDKNHFNALIFLPYVEYVHHGVQPETLKRLESFEPRNNDEKSLIEYVKSLYYLDHDNDFMYEKSLLESIKSSQKFVLNYIKLGRLYIEQGKIEQGQTLLQKASQNVKGSDSPECQTEGREFDIEPLVNELIKGFCFAKE